METAQKHGEMTVKCNTCGKERSVKVLEYYKLGGMRGGCCNTEVKPGVVKACTWSTVVSATKRKTHKSSRDRAKKSSRK